MLVGRLYFEISIAGYAYPICLYVRTGVSDKHSASILMVEVVVVCGVMTVHNLVGFRIVLFHDHTRLIKFVYAVYISLAEVESLLLLNNLQISHQLN
jgi:hypothetical protein